MPQSSFAAQVSEWVAETKLRAELVFKESAQRVIDIAQKPVRDGGNMPVDTGTLRASLMATLGTPGFAVTFNPGTGHSRTYDAGAVSLVIANAKLGDTITAVYTANYALHVEYGTSKMRPRRFVGLAAQQWQRIVDEVCVEAKTRAGG